GFHLFVFGFQRAGTRGASREWTLTFSARRREGNLRALDRALTFVCLRARPCACSAGALTHIDETKPLNSTFPQRASGLVPPDPRPPSAALLPTVSLPLVVILVSLSFPLVVVFALVRCRTRH